jgi:DNA-binding transcriptional LysR family regulator
MSLELANLRAFVAVAELGSFHAAAGALHLSSPALSHRIANLEETLGARLFERTTRQVTLTPIGRELSTKARHLLNEVEGALLGIRDLTQGWKSAVVIACVPSAAYYFLPRVLLRYQKAFPSVHVRIMDEGANDSLSRVLRGEAEFGLNFMGAEQGEIEFEPIMHEEFVLICRRRDPLAGRRKVAWAELSGRRFIGVSRSSGSGIRLLLDLALAEAPERPNFCYEVRHISLLPALVEAGLGIAALPRSAVPDSGRGRLATIPLTGPVVTRTLGLMKRRGRVLSPAAEQLYSMLLRARRDTKKAAVPGA